MLRVLETCVKPGSWEEEWRYLGSSGAGKGLEALGIRRRKGEGQQAKVAVRARSEGDCMSKSSVGVDRGDVRLFSHALGNHNDFRPDVPSCNPK